MKFTETDLSGVYLVELDVVEDERGSFARSFCINEFAEIGIDFSIVQCNISVNDIAGTLRGIHYQKHPFAESKIVRCTRGAIFDVAVDLRPDSDTFRQWYGTKIDSDNRVALLVPPGCAHGFQTLSDSTEVHYLMSGQYESEAAAGVRFDDPAFGIEWPMNVSSISERDLHWPNFDR